MPAAGAKHRMSLYDRVSWGSGCQGISQAISQAIYGSCGGYGGLAGNLVSELKKNNAFHKGT